MTPCDILHYTNSFATTIIFNRDRGANDNPPASASMLTPTTSPPPESPILDNDHRRDSINERAIRNKLRRISWDDKEQVIPWHEQRDFGEYSDSYPYNSQISPSDTDSQIDGDQKGDVDDIDEIDFYKYTRPETIIQKIITDTPDEILDTDEAFHIRVRNALNNPDVSNEFLHTLMVYFNNRMGAVDKAKYLGLARCVVNIKPSLLTEEPESDQVNSLHAALKRSKREPKIMQEFIECICDAASKQDPHPGEKMNCCQQAIHKQHNGLTCLHHAVKENLGVADYLLKIASSDTLLAPCGTDKHTVLHIALKTALRNTADLDWERLIENIVDKAPSILFEVDSRGQSPYPYFIQERREWSTGIDSQPPKGQESRPQHEKSPNLQKNVNKKNKESLYTPGPTGSQTDKGASVVQQVLKKKAKFPRRKKGKEKRLKHLGEY